MRRLRAIGPSTVCCSTSRIAWVAARFCCQLAYATTTSRAPISGLNIHYPILTIIYFFFLPFGFPPAASSSSAALAAATALSTAFAQTACAARSKRMSTSHTQQLSELHSFRTSNFGTKSGTGKRLCSGEPDSHGVRTHILPCEHTDVSGVQNRTNRRTSTTAPLQQHRATPRHQRAQLLRPRIQLLAHPLAQRLGHTFQPATP
jgi:hypothetical protein